MPDSKHHNGGSGNSLTQRWRNLFTGRDRTQIFNDAATAASETGTSYWLVLVLAGAIAALGLALNSSAVIIGAMLIAPLLAPIVGLALALAIGDGRLAIETAIIVLVSTVAVIVVAALLAIALPVAFQTVTTEIAARTRPTTLDLVIAVFSGLAGAVVTVARQGRLAGAVPGVAVAVALVPPLAVTGYGIGIGWNWSLIRGSLLLYGANLAGIVISGMAVFLLAGMHQQEVLKADEAWHRRASSTWLATWVRRTPGLRSLGMMTSIWARIALAVGFVGLVAIPLRESLREIAREARVQSAINDAAAMFSAPGRSFVVSREVDIGQAATRVVMNVATTGWFADSTRRVFERNASSKAGEPVSLVLEQLPASSGDVSNLAKLLSPGKNATAAHADPAPDFSVTSAVLRSQISEAMRGLVLPDSTTIIGFDFTVDNAANEAIHFTYVGSDTLSLQAAQIVNRQLASSLGSPNLSITPEFISNRPRAIRPTGSVMDSVSRLLARHSALRAELTAGRNARQADFDSLAARLRRVARAGSPAVSTQRSTTARGIVVRLLPIASPDSVPQPPASSN